MLNGKKRSFIRNLYLKIGMHGAPRGTLLHYLHHSLYIFFGGNNPELRRLRKLNTRRISARLFPAQFWLSISQLIRHWADIISSREEPCIAIHITGGIGDHLIAARYIRDLQAAVGTFTFDIRTARPAVARWIFAQAPGFRACFDEQFSWDDTGDLYSFELWVTQFIVMSSKRTSLERMQHIHPKLTDVCATIMRFRPKIENIIANHPNLDGYLAHKISFMDMNRHTFLQGMSGIAYGGHTLDLPMTSDMLEKHNLIKNGYVTVHNGFDTEFCVGGSKLLTKSTKTYPHFNEVLAQLRQAYPHLKIVQLGSTTSEPLTNVHLNLVCKTTLPESAEIIRHAALHIDNESGLVHLARCLGVTSCVVFGPTSVEHFAYEDNINMRPTVCGDCWWTTPDWMKNCARGFAEPICLYEQPANTVFQALNTYLKSHLSYIKDTKPIIRAVT